MIAPMVSGTIEKRHQSLLRLVRFSLHPTRALLATSSGQRRFAGDVRVTLSEDEDEENVYAEFNLKKIPRENCVKIWPLVK